MKKLVFSFGRFNPPTTGHEVLLKKVVAVAKKENADAMVYSSQSNDPKKNPLPYKEKTKFMKAMFPKHKKVIQYDVGVKNAFDTLSTVYAKGYRDVTMVVGSDRVTEFEKILNKYNDVEGRHGYYNFESGVKVVSAGARDPDAEGVTGMSASKMRAAAAANDFESFEKGMPDGFKAGQIVFDAVRKGMNLSEEMMEFMESDVEGLREFFETDLVNSLDAIDDEELFESIDEDFGAVPDFATMLAFGMAAKMSFDAVKMLVKTARGVNKIRKWAKRNGNKLRDKVNPAPNFTQFESLDENVLGRYATAGRKMAKRDNAAKDAVQAAGGKDPRINEPKTPEEWMARREYHLKYAARKGMTQPMKDLISKKTMGIHKKSASECREIHNIITGTKMDAMGNWKPNEKFAVREYPHSTPDHITREYNKKKQQYRKRLQSLQTSEHEDTKDLKHKTEKPWYAAMKKHFASHGYISDVPKPDPLDFGITWDIRGGKMPHRPYMESTTRKKLSKVVDKAGNRTQSDRVKDAAKAKSAREKSDMDLTAFRKKHNL
jgi:phosphopantetheine adenylyltransferase